MPSPTTIDEFLELVRKSGVVEDKRLASYLDKARAAQALPSQPMRLAELLVRDGLVTRFQAEQFLQGKWRRFNIGKYKVLEKLGAGGMGQVYLCEHKLMRRRVAVKVLPTAKADDTSSLERFYREARAVAALDHPNIVRAYDIDQDDKLHFLVMEHVDGSSLQEIVKKSGPLDPLRAAHYIRQAALGLQHAHETAAIVHRDIKPGNILVDRNGIVKVLDMGLARFFHDDEDMLTRKYEDNVLGTADYLAPEQALDSHTVDIRADIYSLGATFYFCLTGRTPFAEGTVAQKLIWHQTRLPKPLRQVRPETPEGIVAVVEKMMAKDASQRYPTPAAVADALVPWTQTPIPPPPESEMPQLSPAAMGAAPADPTLPAGPKTPPSGVLGSAARKVWQVSQGATPAPASTPPPSPPPPPAPRDLRKTNPPPPGPLNLQTPAAVPAPSPAAAPPPTIRVPARPQARVAPAPAAAPPRPAVPPPIPKLPAGRPIPGNGTAPAETAETEEPPSWADVVTENGIASSDADTLPRTARKRDSASTKRLSGLQPTIVPPRRLGWAIAIASAIVLVILIVGGILAWTAGKKPDPEPKRPVDPLAVIHVNRLGSNDAAPLLSTAIVRARSRGRLPARIIVHDDLTEGDVSVVDMPNITIEAEEGKRIVWKAPAPKPGSKGRLLTVTKAEGFRLKGFILDGDNQIETLVSIQHYCPAAVFEDLTLKGFKKYGIWIANCRGEESPDRNVILSRLTFESSQPGQTALFFSILESMKSAIPKNKFIIVRDDCKFEGAGEKIKTPHPEMLDHVELPAGVRLAQGQ